MTEVQNTDQQQNLQPKQNLDLDTFKSIYYWANAKPDSQIKFFRERKKVELSDIYDLNQRVDKKLLTHSIETYVVSLNFILTEGNVKEYASWAEFERENWDTINQRVESINLTWDLTFSIPSFAMPQRHTLKVRIGNAIPPKDMLQLMFTTDEPSTLMESQAEGLVKVDFINQVVANELIQIATNWNDGLKKLQKPKKPIIFLERRERYLRSAIEYFVPIVFVSLSYLYHDLLCEHFNFSKELNLLSIQKVSIIFLTLFGFGTLVGKYLSNWFGYKVDRFKQENGILISKGDKNYVEELEKENQNIYNEILQKVIISLIVTIILIGIKYIITKMIGSN